MRLKALLAGVMVASAFPLMGWAQFTQYAAPGSLAEPQKGTKERLAVQMERARWRLGPLRLEPWVGVGNLTYHDDLEPWREGKQADVSLSAGAGLAAFLPAGQRVLLAGYALPERSWWREYSNRNRLKGRYGVGAVADVGRLSLELRGFRATQPWFVGFADEVPIDVRREGAWVGAEMRLMRRLFVFGNAEETRWRHRDEDLLGAPVARLRSLDRDERKAIGGLRYHFRDRLTVSLGYTRTETDFLLPEADRSNSGSAPTLGLAYAGRRLSLSAEVAEHDLSPRQGSFFRPFAGRTGAAQLGWKLGSASGFSVYARESLAFALGGADYYTVNVRGAAVQFPLGWRTRATVFGETGTLSFVAASRADRRVRSYGAEATVNLWRRSSLLVRWDHSNYDAREGELLPVYDRFSAGLNFGFGSAVTW